MSETADVEVVGGGFRGGNGDTGTLETLKSQYERTSASRYNHGRI